jgi:hypothetical protein
MSWQKRLFAGVATVMGLVALAMSASAGWFDAHL